MAYGFVYILGNEYMPDLIKIGCTERSPWERADEISRATGVPVGFQVYCYAEFDNNFQAIERELHQACSRYRVNPAREFFHGCLPFAVSLLWFHPRRLSFTDATAGSRHPESSELVMRACTGQHYFNGLYNPYSEQRLKEEAGGNVISLQASGGGQA